MKKAYVLVYNDGLGTREQLIEALNQCRTVITWRYDMANAIYIISENTADEIAKDLETIRPPGNSRYLLLEYNGNAQGRATEETWYLLNNKEFKSET
ncbi:hypothetical protein HB761_14060 [Vibrio campbellii]|uniref:Uncharacterized protein n=1 Tax=Vibrio campbellii TaxID=680 RepID=A0AAE9SLL1_9VIBR|nr:hypothetical protein [Vibrio campbellii]UTZ27771.1 hypothetical protein HB761_14060 [Vibrio campbellii]